MGGVVDGQPVSAAITNPSFIIKNADDTTPSKLGLANTDPLSGGSIVNTQREFNALDSFTGNAANSVFNHLPSWSNNDVGTSADNLKARADSITQKFNVSAGHAHDGTAGNGKPIATSALSGTALLEFLLLGNDMSVTGTSTDVSAFFTGQTASTTSTIAGPITITPFNKVIVTQGASASSPDQPYTDSSGNVVFARLTFAASVWTLSYVSEIAGVETAYTFPASSPIHWYYNALANPITAASPVYSYTSIVAGAGGGGTSLSATVRSGSSSLISLGSVSKAITFSSPLSTTGYSITAQFVNVNDVFPQYQPITITTKNASGFTAAWNSGVDTGNYFIDYQAIIYT